MASGCNDIIFSVNKGTTPPVVIDPDEPDPVDPEEKITEHNYTVRVIGEDLTFGEDVDADFDFNDVVFDVALESNSTWIKLKAAGGTLPLIIGVANPQDDQDYNSNEVHHLFGLTDTGVMINTNASAKNLRGADLDDVEFELTTAYSNAKEIPVYVKKNGQWIELQAVKKQLWRKFRQGCFVCQESCFSEYFMKEKRNSHTLPFHKIRSQTIFMSFDICPFKIFTDYVHFPELT